VGRRHKHRASANSANLGTFDTRDEAERVYDYAWLSTGKRAPRSGVGGGLFNDEAQYLSDGVLSPLEVSVPGLSLQQRGVVHAAMEPVLAALATLRVVGCTAHQHFAARSGAG
jgi:hypothetical protein